MGTQLQSKKELSKMTSTGNACTFVLVSKSSCSVCQQQEGILDQLKTDHPQITVVKYLDTQLVELNTNYPETYNKFNSCSLVPVTGVYDPAGVFLGGFCNLQSESTLTNLCGSKEVVSAATAVGAPILSATTETATAPTNAVTFQGYMEIDILPYLTRAHNGQPTPGVHSVTIYLI
jgi:hypothetical protein